MVVGTNMENGRGNDSEECIGQNFVKNKGKRRARIRWKRLAKEDSKQETGQQ